MNAWSEAGLMRWMAQLLTRCALPIWTLRRSTALSQRDDTDDEMRRGVAHPSADALVW